MKINHYEITKQEQEENEFDHTLYVNKIETDHKCTCDDPECKNYGGALWLSCYNEVQPDGSYQGIEIEFDSLKEKEELLQHIRASIEGYVLAKLATQN